MYILTFKNVTLYWILSHVLDQYNGFVTLKDFEFLMMTSTEWPKHAGVIDQ